ncbi:MAG: hypothetical protein DRI65_13300 [Chloroflexota bacterium]|nr:MAG: hypothetical protein DRI65_13300 [Chloroflexota bacterium]
MSDRINTLASYKDFPRKLRTPIRKVNAAFKRGETSNDHAMARRALQTAETDLRDLLNEAISLGKKYDKLYGEMLTNGFLFYDYPVVPTDAGFSVRFEEVAVAKDKYDKQVYRKDGLYMWHIQDDLWTVKGKAWKMPIVMKLPSMADFFICMRSLGVTIDVNQIMDAD